MTKYRKLLFIIFILTSQGLLSQTILLPKEEAPFSIFSSSIGDADVDLYLSGSWETKFQGGFGYAWDSTGEKTKTSSFPGMAAGYQMTYQPDIIISLWLMNRYFFETSFIDNYELNTILFGYEAVEEGFLRSVRIGNTDIGFGEYSWLQIPEASTDSFGGIVLFKNERSEHQFMMRFDPADMQIKNFIGKNEVDPVRLDLTDYTEGRYFILPDNNVTNLKIYIEDSSGIYSDGKHQYRLADSNDAIISAEEGIVFFRETLTVRAAVHYTKGGSSVGDPGLGRNSLAGENSGKIDISETTHFDWSVDDYLEQDMAERQLIIGSQTALLLYEPGVFSPFEMLSIYSLPYLIPDSPSLFTGILADINLTTGDKLNFSTAFEDYSVRIIYNGESYRDPANRYPLAMSIDSDVIVYEPDRQLEGTPPDKELLFQRLFPIGSYYLGDNVLDGSVTVNINGFSEYRYTFDPDSGNVTFMFPVPSDAQIEISYRTKAATGMSGDLIMGLGSKFNFTDNFFMETGAGLRWNVQDSEYTEKAEEATGSILGTAGISYKTDNLDFKLDTGISIYSPNTTGIMRLAGMNKNGFDIPLSANYLYPAAPPESGGMGSLQPEKRGRLYYKDYHKYNSSGSSTLKDYDWAPPSDQIYAYNDGGRTGPYIAGTDSEIEGKAAVFEYDLGNSEWTGGRIPLVLGTQALDLSETQSISLKWKHIDVAGSVDIYIRVGKLSEDLDGDGILDEEISQYESGFNFNDGSYQMKVGLAPDSNLGNDQLDTEDLDGNSILDKEGSELVYTKKETSPGSSWQTITLNLAPSDRKKLKAVTGFEIIIVENNTANASGRLLVGDIVFSGSSFVIKSSAGQTTVREINELYSTVSGSLLTEDFSEVEIYSSGTGPQNVAEINWDAADTWEAAVFTEAANLSDYNKISFYMKTSGPAPDNITFALTNPSGKGISLSFKPIASNNWEKYTIDYRAGSIISDGTAPDDITWIKSDLNAANVNRLSLSANCSSEGTLLLDEVHLEDPVVGVSGAASSVFNYRKSGTILDVNGISLLSNFNFSNTSRIIGQNFASGFTNNNDSNYYTASSLSINILAMRINGKINLQWQDSKTYSSPGVSFTIPFFDNMILINDSYNEVNMPLSQSISRKESITISPGISTLEVLAETSFNGQNLTRNWGYNSKTVWDTGSQFSTDIILNMISKENPYEGLDSMEKLLRSYRVLTTKDDETDRNTSIMIKPHVVLEKMSLTVKESLTSNIYGIDERILATDQIVSVNAKFEFNSKNNNQWYLIPGYIKTIRLQNTSRTDNNFITDTEESIMKLSKQEYYFAGIPLWEIIYPDFGKQFTNITKGNKSAEYIPKFSIQFKRPTGSSFSDIIIPSFVDFSISRNLNRDFDSVTDKLNANIETRATALNLFGQLGTTPLFNWYQTEEITNILSAGGQYRSYMTDFLQDPLFNINYTLYLNFSITQEDYIDFESSHNWTWDPLEWNSSTSGSYKWLIKPDTPIKIPLLCDDSNKPYYEHIEKITVAAGIRDEKREKSLTLTANHTTNLIISDTGVISLFVGIGWDQTNISIDDVTTKYYMFGLEAGISAKLTF